MKELPPLPPEVLEQWASIYWQEFQAFERLIRNTLRAPLRTPGEIDVHWHRFIQWRQANALEVANDLAGHQAAIADRAERKGHSRSRQKDTD